MELMASYDRHHPLDAVLLSRVPLSRGESEREAYHLVVDIHESHWHYSCGDSLAIFPRNDPLEVLQVLQKLDLNPLEKIFLPGIGEQKTLQTALEDIFCIMHLPKRFGEFLQQKVSPSREGIYGLSIPREDGGEWESFLQNHTLHKALELFPNFRCTSQELLEHLHPMRPRLYSIASSPTMFPNEIHLAVVMVHYRDIYGEERWGVATRTLSPRGVAIGDRVRCFLVHSHFSIPEDIRRDMIMVGPGTGVAPFRSFIGEYAARRSAGEKTGRTWLFFGSHHRHSHFYYEEEWKELLANGNLTHLTLAFSRDQEEKIYVQHRLLEQGAEVARWILDGAHFYICGDATFMAKDVERALGQILQQHAAIHDPQAYLRTMRQEKRYMRDVY
jgi:sulfite reductase (NADPH) flavoprotein alpha-component